MNFYGKIYNDGENTHISVIEGLYYLTLLPKARVIGDINITENKFCKYVKQPYDVINIGENIITLKKRQYDMTTHIVSYETTYFLLTNLLIEQGVLPERIAQILYAIDAISSNRNIKTNQSCVGEHKWINI